MTIRRDTDAIWGFPLVMSAGVARRLGGGNAANRSQAQRRGAGFPACEVKEHPDSEALRLCIRSRDASCTGKPGNLRHEVAIEL